jgi:hypothetical protein
MRRAFEAAARGEGSGILVSGAPSVGKTALIEELRPVITARHRWFVYGKVDQFRHDAVSGPIIQAIRGLGRMLLAESPVEVAAPRACILAALGERVVRHVLAVAEARHYEPATSQVRHMLSRTSLHWFGELELVADHAKRARLGLLLGGELHLASFTYCTTLAMVLEIAPVIEHHEAETDLAVAYGMRTGKRQSATTYIVFRRLLRALRGQTESPGSFYDATFDEARRLATLAANRKAEAYLHTYSALTAASLGASLIHHAAAAMDLRGHLDGFYRIALAYMLQGLAVARRLRGAAGSKQAALRTEFDTCRMWLAQRAADAPGNYLHSVHLFDAGIAWASNDYWVAQCAFDAGITLTHRVHRP